MIKRVYNRPGSRGHRNAENNPLDNNDRGEIDSSGHKIREVHATDNNPRKFQSRERLDRTGQKRPNSQDETRDSSRMPARGQAEFMGQMNKRVVNKGSNVRRSTSATKSKTRAESP
jgi:hypothetical protein